MRSEPLSSAVPTGLTFVSHLLHPALNYRAKVTRPWPGLTRLVAFRLYRDEGLLAETTRMRASPDGPTFRVPTMVGSPSRMEMSVVMPVFSY